MKGSFFLQGQIDVIAGRIPVDMQTEWRVD